MSQEKVLRTLESLGLSQYDAQVYLFLGKKGPQKAKDIAQPLRMPKQYLYLVLKNLQRKGIVNATLERPAKFSAVSFEKVLDLFVKAKMEEAQRIQQDKTNILLDWQSIAFGETADQAAKFTVLEGRNFIYSKFKQMIEETKNRLLIISTIPGLIRVDQQGLLETASKLKSKSKIQFRFLTELSEQNLQPLKSLLDRTRKKGFRFEGRVPELGLKLFTRIMIRDSEEALFFVTPETETTQGETDVCLWTNCKSLVNSFSAVFEDLWRNSKDIQKKIVEIETGKPTPKMDVINDGEIAREKYHEILRSAKKEIIMLTSSEGLIGHWKSENLRRKWAKRGVSVRIMAPITRQNLEIAQKLGECCEVRHFPLGYLGTAVIDGQHLFQFKNPPPEQEELRAIPYLEDIFYTNDYEFVTKTKNMLNDAWKNASGLPTITLRSINWESRTITKKESPTNVFTERKLEKEKKKNRDQEIAVGEDKVSVPKRLLEAARETTGLHCATRGCAIIHPPKDQNMPDMLIQVSHYGKESEFGEADVLELLLWLNGSKGPSFVPVAVVHDGNPESVALTRKIWQGTAAGENVILVRPEELQVWREGKTLFAGWTVSIPILPPKYNLSPSVILFEGYGDSRPATISCPLPSGYLVGMESDSYDAFVTFMNPSWKYVGPGTNGAFSANVIHIITRR